MHNTYKKFSPFLKPFALFFNKREKMGARGAAQVVEYLPSKHKALKLNPSLTKN
jgi:hypothetical protein